MATKKTASTNPTKSSVSAKKTVKKTTRASSVTKSMNDLQENSSMSAMNMEMETGSMLMKQRKLFIVGLIALVVLGLYYFKGTYLAAVVDGKPIWRWEVIRELESQSGAQALNALVSQQLVYSEAKSKNIVVTQEEIDKEFKKLEDSVKKDNQTFEDFLEYQNITREQLTKQIKIQLTVEKLLADSIKVTDAEVAKVMEEQKASLPAGMSEAQLKESIMQNLKNDKISAELQTLLEKLKKERSVTQFVTY